MIKNNYGKYLDSEVPSPGVISSNRLAWEYIDNEICLDCEEIMEKLDSQCEDEMNSGWENIECFGHTKLIGDWLKDEKGKYYPDETGEFAAKIDSQNDVIVLWSKFTVQGTPCSPCAPWGVSIDEPGEFLCYTLPDYLLEKDV
jgi:hypothetical protein